MKTNKRKKHVHVLNVTKRDYEREIASGIDPEYALQPGKHYFRRARRFASAEDITRAKAKVTVSIRLDPDVVDFFKKRADAPNAAPYQTQINQALREYIESRGDDDAAFDRLLKNERFITAVAKRIREFV